MFPKFIKLGVETILKIFCEKIIIRNIQIVSKNNNFNDTIDKIYIKAESIIFNKINISNINIYLRDVVLRFAFKNKKIFLIDNCYALIFMRLTKDNINKTLFSKKWKSLKTSIESFISMNFQSIEVYNKSIYFVPQDGFSYKNIDCTLQYDKNSISLVNNINQEKLPILNDKNIDVKNLFFCESCIELELSSKIDFN
tara:strand:+ start:229 stop:819 length:591 start_codon:yes stop_codon:yes gene_type:complete